MIINLIHVCVYILIIYCLGIHWIAISMMPHDRIIELFDSFGREPLREEILKKLKAFSSVKYSVKQIQSCYTSVCGVYCCLFALWKCTNLPFETFLDEFSDSLLENDTKVVEMFNNSFSNQSAL